VSFEGRPDYTTVRLKPDTTYESTTVEGHADESWRHVGPHHDVGGQQENRVAPFRGCSAERDGLLEAHVPVVDLLPHVAADLDEVRELSVSSEERPQRLADGRNLPETVLPLELIANGPDGRRDLFDQTVLCLTFLRGRLSAGRSTGSVSAVNALPSNVPVITDRL
jgi:hypothetical protein